jgi:hypothetical protein
MEPPTSVFISSIQTGFEDVRGAAREGAESFGLRVLMAETAGAAPASSQRALLELVETADVFLLLIGPRYGEPGQSGRSPTEEEFEHARALGKDILVLVYAGQREPEADAFLTRVQGTWEEGYYAPRFERAEQVVGLVVRSLRDLAERRSAGAAAPEARDRARELAAGERRGGMPSGARVRVAQVPVGAPLLLDAPRLDAPDLPDALAAMVRDAGVVPQSAGIETHVSGAGVRLIARQERAWSSPEAFIGADGAVVIEADVAAEGSLGSGQLDHGRVVTAIGAAGRLARNVWGTLDKRGRVRQVAVAIGVPDADGKLYVTRPTGSSTRVPMTNPATVLAPDPPTMLRREDIGLDSAITELAVSLKRAFADLGALEA